jgi:hypothetical protein
LLLEMSIHQTLDVSPDGLAFQRDMLHPIPILANFELIHQQRQTLTDSSAHCENLH